MQKVKKHLVRLSISLIWGGIVLEFGATVRTAPICAHCGLSAGASSLSGDGDRVFCSRSCQMVHRCLKDGGLSHFYDILRAQKKSPPSSREVGPQDFLRDKEFLQSFGQGRDKNRFFFYVEGISCMACTWVFKNIDHIHEGIAGTRFDLRNNVLAIEVVEPSALLEVAQFVGGLGYKLIPLKNVPRCGKEVSKTKACGIETNRYYRRYFDEHHDLLGSCLRGSR